MVPPVPFISLAIGLQAAGGEVFFGYATRRDGGAAIHVCWLRLAVVVPAAGGPWGFGHRGMFPACRCPGLYSMHNHVLIWSGCMGDPNAISWCRKVDASKRLVH